MLHAVSQPVEGGTFGIVAESDLGFGGFVQSDAATMARQQDFALGFGLVEFVFEFEEC